MVWDKELQHKKVWTKSIKKIGLSGTSAKIVIADRKVTAKRKLFNRKDESGRFNIKKKKKNEILNVTFWAKFEHMKNIWKTHFFLHYSERQAHLYIWNISIYIWLL